MVCSAETIGLALMQEDDYTDPLYITGTISEVQLDVLIDSGARQAPTTSAKT
jgi:hypothetical protein